MVHTAGNMKSWILTSVPMSHHSLGTFHVLPWHKASFIDKQKKGTNIQMAIVCQYYKYILLFNYYTPLCTYLLLLCSEVTVRLREVKKFTVGHTVSKWGGY